MRRAQSVRNTRSRPSMAHAVDDLGVLGEEESLEDSLRRQLLEKDRENDKLKSDIQLLQAQLAARPPIERIQELEKEYKNLDLILQGTQRENERCMAELERGKKREKMLERELTKLAGENWQTSLDFPSSSKATTSDKASRPPSNNTESKAATLERLEQVRLLILGMESRLATREQCLEKTVEKAEEAGKKWEMLAAQVQV